MVSIITPTYNRAHLIGKTIQSVISQSYSDFELLILDDGSDDNTESIVKGFSDSRIKYFHFPHSGRISQLRNFGIKNARYPFIAFIDSDDLWEKEKLWVQLEALNKHDSLGYVFSDLIKISGETTKRVIYSKKYKPESFSYFHEMIGNKLSLYPSSLLFRKNCIEKTGLLNESMVAGEQDFITRLAFHFDGILIPQPLVTIRIHGENHSLSNSIGAHMECIDTLELFYKKKSIGTFLYRRKAAFHFFSIAMIYRKRGNRAEARRNFKKCVFLNPFSIKNIGGFILSAIP